MVKIIMHGCNGHMSQVLVTRWLNVDCRGKNFSLQQKYGLQMQDMKKQKLLLKSL